MPLAALALAAACWTTTSQADAQVMVASGTIGATQVNYGAPYAVWTSVAAYGPSAAWSFRTPVLPYSYYAAFPNAPRIYVGYGANDFPFYGQPYGNPSDRWSWAYMTNGSRGLDRYYYPPVR
jgi:hypothetical protein